VHPRADLAARYVHAVFSRLAAQGHLITCIAHKYPWYDLAEKRVARIETVGGVQVARIGSAATYPFMVQLLFSRLSKAGPLSDKYDVIMPCITRKRLPLDGVTGIPIIPLVFGLSARPGGAPLTDGPVIAATERARRQLQRAGTPDRAVVRAPYGVDPAFFDAPTSRGRGSPERIVGVGRPGKALAAALRRLRSAGLHLDADFVPLPSGADVGRPARYAAATLGYCAPGSETEALALGACGVPVVCADTPAGREFVIDGETGLLVKPRHVRHLAECLGRLARDPALRERLGARARAQAQEVSWERTTSLVLATIENL